MPALGEQGEGEGGAAVPAPGLVLRRRHRQVEGRLGVLVGRLAPREDQQLPAGEAPRGSRAERASRHSPPVPARALQRCSPGVASQLKGVGEVPVWELREVGDLPLRVWGGVRQQTLSTSLSLYSVCA